MTRWTQKAMAEHIKGMDPVLALQFLLEQGLHGCKLMEKVQRHIDAKNKELCRLESLRGMEADFWREGFDLVGGMDEAGRGPLAGPVVAACVVLPREVWLEKLNDSKKLSPKVRDCLYDEIRKKAIAWGIGACDAAYIDRVNILNATKKAMLLALEAMKTKPDALVLDAIRLEVSLPQISVPEADSRSLAVAAASVLAKVSRDRWMEKLDVRYPAYGFARHKGYGTQEHVEAIRQNGLTPFHRRSFTGNIVVEGRCADEN